MNRSARRRVFNRHTACLFCHDRIVTEAELTLIDGETAHESCAQARWRAASAIAAAVVRIVNAEKEHA